VFPPFSGTPALPCVLFLTLAGVVLINPARNAEYTLEWWKSNDLQSIIKA
jgi:hypothetical protein